MSNGFKLIAIRPLEGCDKKYLRVLSPDEPFFFYKDYKFKKEKNGEANESIIEYKPSIPDSLFNQSALKINISAIVGKNGSGKSTLIELFFMAINNITAQLRKEKKIHSKPLDNIDKLYVEFYFMDKDIFKFKIEGDDVSISRFGYDSDQSSFILDSDYSNNNLNSFELVTFFYTLGVNYSHYSLNSNDIGNWISEVFHKNDSYQAPISVSPFRKDGNIDVNNETGLAKSRLLSYLAEFKESRVVTNKQTVVGVNFSLNLEKVKYVYTYEFSKTSIPNKKISFDDFYKNNSKDEIIKAIFSVYEIDIDNSHPHREFLVKYIIKKLVSISLTYDLYTGCFELDTGKFKERPFKNNLRRFEGGLVGYLNAIKEDSSHITFKLNQAINFLKNNYTGKIKNSRTRRFYMRLDLLESKLRELSRSEKKRFIDLIPPSIYTYDFKLKSKDGKISFFKDLSSGEKQLVYSTYSLLYHMYNIDSPRQNGLINYRNINIIFEEIELYFHPEQQKQFINYLLNKLHTQKLINIKSMNICFVTHSPFILSDIPTSNILFLKVDNKSHKASSVDPKLITFGSNIHNVLKNAFFMEDGTMGEFAKGTITQLIEDLKKDEFTDKDYAEKVIQNIGEPLIKNRLQELFVNKFGTKEEIRKQIEHLQRLLEE
jgi:energy-coupling factor transporter ATP-binding protein EcfA2